MKWSEGPEGEILAMVCRLQDSNLRWREEHVKRAAGEQHQGFTAGVGRKSWTCRTEGAGKKSMNLLTTIPRILCFLQRIIICWHYFAWLSL